MASVAQGGGKGGKNEKFVVGFEEGLIRLREGERESTVRGVMYELGHDPRGKQTRTLITRAHAYQRHAHGTLKLTARSLDGSVRYGIIGVVEGDRSASARPPQATAPASDEPAGASGKHAKASRKKRAPLNKAVLDQYASYLALVQIQRAQGIDPTVGVRFITVHLGMSRASVWRAASAGKLGPRVDAGRRGARWTFSHVEALRQGGSEGGGRA